MARGSDQAQQGAKNALSQSTSAYNTLIPSLTQNLTAPPGFSPEDFARMYTGEMQTLGGSNAGAVGQGALLSARTRNAGTADAAIQKSARDAGEQLSQRGLDIDLANQRLKEQQREGAQRGLENIYGIGTGAVAPDVNANTNAAEQSWDWAKYILDPIIEGGSKAGAAKLAH